MGENSREKYLIVDQKSEEYSLKVTQSYSEKRVLRPTQLLNSLTLLDKKTFPYKLIQTVRPVISYGSAAC
jgi:hypothetical protein